MHVNVFNQDTFVSLQIAIRQCGEAALVQSSATLQPQGTELTMCSEWNYRIVRKMCSNRRHHHHSRARSCYSILAYLQIQTQPGLLLSDNHRAFIFDCSEAEAATEACQAQLCSFYNFIYQHVLPSWVKYLHNIWRVQNKPMDIKNLLSVPLAAIRTEIPNAEIKHTD